MATGREPHIVACWWCKNNFESHHRFEELCPPCQAQLDKDMAEHDLAGDQDTVSLEELQELEHVELGED